MAGNREWPEVMRLVAAGLCLVVAVEVYAVLITDRQYVLLASGATAAVVLLAARRLMDSATKPVAQDAVVDGPAESMRRWIARTESMIRWADASRADWDRQLRPRLAREFLTATGQRATTDPAALQATGRLVFGDELWQWVDPSNVARTGRREPGPGRGALDEILQRLERV